jgi:hypothetical protein
MVKRTKKKDADFSFRIVNEEQESFSSLLPIHLTKLKDKINALKVINDISLEALENYLESQNNL